MTLINPATFEASGETRTITLPSGTQFHYEEGTVEVTLGRETRRLPASRDSEGGVSVGHGLFGTYATSSKRWPAFLKLDEKGREFARFGRDDRSGRFNKIRGIAFA
jgi:hypothetical protein